MQHTILMIAPTSFFADYGCHVRILEEIIALQRRGHRVVLTTYHNGDTIPGIETRRSWDVPWIKRAMVGSSRHKLYLDAALSWRALRVAAEVRPTIIHAHLHEGALIGGVLRRLFRVPLIFDYQGSMTSEMIDHGFLKRDGALFPMLAKIETQINRQADTLVTSTWNAARMLVRSGTVDPERVTTVIDRVDTQRFTPAATMPDGEAMRHELRVQLGIPPDRRIVAYLGLLAPYQGTNILIEAARQVVAAQPDAHFLIMGYPDPASYRAYAESLGIGDHVTLPGRIYYRDAPAYLSLGEIAVAPKMSMTEGSGKISNYMAMGLPVVTFDTPVSREILGNTGLYASFGSVDALAAQILRLLREPDLAQNLREQARARVISDFSWDQAARQLEAVYADALLRMRRRPQVSVPTQPLASIKPDPAVEAIQGAERRI